MQYKFRGKRIDNGEWVYGDKLTTPQGTFIIPDQADSEAKHLYGQGDWTLCVDSFFEVHPDSVGMLAQSQRYKGNDRDIYKDDIFTNKAGSLYVVIWNPLSVRFQLKTYKRGPGSGQCWPFEWTGYDNFSLIGNTTDNPELLEKQ